MHVIRKLTVVLALTIFSTLAHTQSLGDVARQNRQQQQDQQNQANQPKKVYGNDDLPQEGLADDDSASSVPDRSQSTSAQSSASQTADAKAASGAQMKSQIQAQQNAIASLQAQIDRINASIHFVTAKAYYNGVQYNEHQVEKQQEVQRLQGQLDEQKAKLQQMQEAARHAGFGNSVYEP